MIRRLSTTFAAVILGGIGIAYAATNFSTFVSSRSGATQPLGASDWVAVYQGGTTTHIAGNLFIDTNSTQTLSNKTISDSNNTLSVSLTKSVTGTLPLGSGGLGLGSGNSGGLPCFNTASTIASTVTLTANLPLIGGGTGACPGVGTTTGSGTLFVTGTGSYASGHGLSIDGGGHIVDNANAVFTNVAQTFTQQQIFGSVRGRVRTTSSNTDTLDVSSASTSDCGGTVQYTGTGTGSPAAVTVTAPATAVLPCDIALKQMNTGRVVVVAASGATVGNPHGFTGTFNAPKSVIWLTANTNAGGVAADYSITGDGQ